MAVLQSSPQRTGRVAKNRRCSRGSRPSTGEIVFPEPNPPRSQCHELPRPLSVRATVRTRRWYLDQIEREVNMQTAPLKLYPRRTSTKPLAALPKNARLPPSRGAEPTLRLTKNEFGVTVHYRHSRESGNP